MKNLFKIISIFAISILFSATSFSTPINQFINSVSPPMNANSVVKSSNIVITFDQVMNGSTMTAANVKVFGYQTGLMTISLDFNSVANTLTINPMNEFKNGEKISITLTSGIKTVANLSISPFVFSFRSRTLGGTGNFTKTSDIPTIEFAYILSGDLDNDSDIDLLIDDKIYKNNGNALFTYYSSLNFGGRATMADFDNDGDLDILVRDNNDIFFMKNNGNGDFTQTNSFTGGIGSFGDLNGDGFLDVTYFLTNRHIYTVLNNNGIFTPDSTVYLFSSCYNNSANHIDYRPMIDDMDNDGDLDMVGINGFGHGNSIEGYKLCRTFFLLLNNGSGLFTPNTIFTKQSGGPAYVMFLDDSKSFDNNNDGIVDVNSPEANLRNNGNGVFLDQGGLFWFFNSSEADYNGDGYLDLMGLISQSPLILYLNDGSGIFNSVLANSSQFYESSASGDFDNDGDIDLAAMEAYTYKVAILLNGDSPLPVELSSFTSSINLNSVKLKWTTSQEQNNSGFEIQRADNSNEGQEAWKKVDFINGSGNSNTEKNYSYEDKNLASGKYKYRLKQIDFNGNFEYHELSNEVVIG
ncbi:MAG: FG-GAP-like repeat-containing protein, partial [Ignavibacteria bacterium]